MKYHYSTMKPQEALNQLEETLELYFGKKAPSMPTNIKETLVNLGPWILMIMLILTVPGLLAAFGVGAILSPLSYFYGVSTGINFVLSWVILVAMVVLEVKALPGLFKRHMASWRLMYYASLLGALQSLVSFNIPTFIVGSALSMYILFQIKPLYK